MSIINSRDERVRLDIFDNLSFSRGASRFTELLWIVLSSILFDTWIPGSGWRRVILRAFGAQIARDVVIKPRVRVKFPWRLKIGANAWIGEGVWIDNLDWVTIGAHSCLSQGAFICTGSHDWSKRSFDLITEQITIGDGVWIAARAVVGPGSTLGDGVVLTLGSLGIGEMTPWRIYSGFPATAQKSRRIED